MLFCVAGDSHGKLDRLHADIYAFELVLGVTFPWVLHVGDFGIWPDKAPVDKTTWASRWQQFAPESAFSATTTPDSMLPSPGSGA